MPNKATTRRFFSVVVALALTGVSGCSTLPEAQRTEASSAADPASGGFLAETAAAVAAKRGDADSSFLLLPEAKEALDIRLALIENAQTSLDIQYFIWNGDAAGSLAWEAVASAADRGVRVRMLVDDLYMASKGNLDPGLAAISAHPNIELRIFNPGKYRSGTAGLAGNFLTRFSEFNRRMHNKLLIADGQFAVIGGRNVGNEYYGLNEAYNFLDLDVLLAGAGVVQAGIGFDEYWNDDSAYPASSLAETTKEDFDALRRENDAIIGENADKLSSYLGFGAARKALFAGVPERMSAGNGRYLQDPAEDTESEDLRIYSILSAEGVEGVDRMYIVTAYFIPRGNMLEQLKADIDGGMEVHILTNSMASNDHTAAASQYNKFRSDILATGVHLYEFKHQPAAPVRAMADVEPVRGGFIGLHSKAGVDNTGKCFVGSLNLDPRAIDINTENGMDIESDELCDDLRELIVEQMRPENAWKVTLNDNGQLQWTSDEGSFDQQPARSTGQRVSGALFRILPLQEQL